LTRLLSRKPKEDVVTSSLQAKIRAFFDGKAFAVVGASRDRGKYGNKVLRAYLQNGLKVFAVNPRETEIEGLVAYPGLGSLPEPVHGVSIVTPPAVTEEVVRQAAAAGIRHVWMQPGAESPEALRRAEALGLEVIAGGPCALVALGYHE
jgi:predicted CoA-binding protein